jgi:hypothetical protein
MLRLLHAYFKKFDFKSFKLWGYLFFLLCSPESQGILMRIIKDPGSPYTRSNFKQYFRLRYVCMYEGGTNRSV